MVDEIQNGHEDELWSVALKRGERLELGEGVNRRLTAAFVRRARRKTWFRRIVAASTVACLPALAMIVVKTVGKGDDDDSVATKAIGPESVVSNRQEVVQTEKEMRKTGKLMAMASLAVVAANGADMYYAPTGATADERGWEVAENWAGVTPARVPGADDKVTINGKLVNSETPLVIGSGVKATVNTLGIATLTSGKETYVGDGRIPAVRIEEGGLLHTTAAVERELAIGRSPVGYGLLTMTGGMVSNCYVAVAAEGLGTLTNAGGTVMMASATKTPWFYVGGTAYSGNGTGTGTVVQTSGQIVCDSFANRNARNLALGYNVGSKGTLEMKGGWCDTRVFVGWKGEGEMRMSGGVVSNNVFVGTADGGVGTVEFTGGEIAGDVRVGRTGRGRMVYDGGRQTVGKNGLSGSGQTVSDIGGCLFVGVDSGAYGEIETRKAGLSFQSNAQLFLGCSGWGRFDAFTALSVPYLKIGGGTNQPQSVFTAHGGNLTVPMAASIGGYAASVNGKTLEMAGEGALVLSNATLVLSRTKQTGDASDPIQILLGRYAKAYGEFRGFGSVKSGGDGTGNTVRMNFGNGKVIADGLGEADQSKLTLEMSLVIFNERLFDNAADGTSGWYAVNGARMWFPRAYLGASDSSGVIGDKNGTNLVNCVGYTIKGATAGAYLHGGVYADDRDEVHKDRELPRNRGVVGVWQLGVWSDRLRSGFSTFSSADLTFRYDHTKVRPRKRMTLWRRNSGNTCWESVATLRHDPQHPYVSVRNVKSTGSKAFNVGLFALTVDVSGLSIVVR